MDSWKRVTRIVAATDFSEGAAQAVARAALLASEHGAALELVHVVPGDALYELRWIASPDELGRRLCGPAREALEALAAGVPHGVGVTTHVEVGDVVDRITERAGADALLVAGARGEGALRDLLLGTTAERLASRAAGPVLLVKSPASHAYRHVLAALDLREGSARVLEAALRVAPGARATAAHAYEVPFEGMLHRAGIGAAQIDHHRGEALRQAIADIDAMARRVSSDGAVRVLPVVERAHPARLLLDRAESLGADLVVVGKRRRTALERLLLGSVARHVTSAAPCDVLAVPQAA